MKHLMKKAVKAAVFAALTTLALTAFASAEGEMAIGAGCTTGTSLRMRSEPNTSSAIVTTLNKSVAVALLDDSVPGWYKINYNGSTGYVSSDYLILDQDNIFTTYGRVPEGTVNVRADATTESESLATIDAGTARNAGVDFAAVLNGTTPAEDFAGYPSVHIAPDLFELRQWLEG